MTIDAQSVGSVVHCISGEGSGTEFRNLILTGGRAMQGAGMYIFSSSPTLRNLTISNNHILYNELSYTGGAGIIAFGDGTPTIAVWDCRIIQNTTPFLNWFEIYGNLGGGVLSIGSSFDMVGGEISNNSAEVGGGVYCFGGVVTFDGVEFMANEQRDDESKGANAIFCEDGNVSLLECDIEGNYGAGRKAVTCWNCPESTLTDCMFTGNTSTSSSTGHVVFNTASVPNQMSMTRCTIQANGMHGFWNSGTAELTDCVITSNEGFGLQTHPSGTTSIQITTVCENQDSQIDGEYTDLGGNCISDICDSDADGIDDCEDPCRYWPGPCDHLDVVVDPGDSIQDAVDSATSGDVIGICEGTYYESDIDLQGKAIVLEGYLYDGDETPTVVIDAQDSGHVMHFSGGETAETVIQNLKLTGGNSVNGGAIYGGAIYCTGSSPMLQNCVLIDNFASAGGGGLFSDSSSHPALMGISVCGNSPQDGSGQIVGTYEDLGNNCISDICDTDSDGILDGCDLCPNWVGSCTDGVPTIHVELGSDPESNKSAIEDAFDAIPDGGIVSLPASSRVVHGIIVPDKPLTLTGQVDATTGEPSTHLRMGGPWGEGGDVLHPWPAGITIENTDSSIAIHNLSLIQSHYKTGVKVSNANLEFVNCTFSDFEPSVYSNDIDHQYGGVMTCVGSDLLLRDCVFEQNSAHSGGGAIFFRSSSAVVERCEFTDNTSVLSGDLDEGEECGGGAILAIDSSLAVVDCTFVENNDHWALYPCFGEAINYSSGTLTVSGTKLCGNANQWNPQIFPSSWNDQGGNCIVIDCSLCEYCPSDINEDEDVGLLDLQVMVDVWGSSDVNCDTDGDGNVGILDLLTLLTSWGPCAY